MEFQIVFSLLVFIIAFYHLLTKLRSTHDNLPPQPWKLPFIGHLHHLSGSFPHRALGNLAQKLGPVIRLQLGEITVVVISSPDVAKQVMQTHDLCFANRPKLLTAEIMGYNYTDIVFSPYGDYWRQIRKICVLELLSVKKVQSFESIREQESWNLVESMVNEGPVVVNLTNKIFTMVNAIVFRVAVGSCRNEEQATLLALIQEIISLSGGFNAADLFPSVKLLHVVTGIRKKMMNIRAKIDKILDGIISSHVERRAGVQITDYNEDLLDVLLRVKDDGGLQFPLTNDNIKAILMDVFAGGTDTTSVTIEWAMFELMRNPRVMKKAQTELRHILKGKKKIYESDIQKMDYLRLVIKETLRVHPPLPLLIPRECREKCKIGGYNIPANTRVIINAWKSSIDPDYWVDPESFIPERFSKNIINLQGRDFEYLPFGSGRRMCPGLTLGMANVELPLARLLYHFNWELPSGVKLEDLDASETFGAALKRKNALHLVASACNIN